MACELSVQAMQFPSWRIHIERRFRIVEREQLQPKLGGMLRLDASLGAGAEEFLQAPVPEASNHYV